jgi:hypothetical protein
LQEKLDKLLEILHKQRIKEENEFTTAKVNFEDLFKDELSKSSNFDEFFGNLRAQNTAKLKQIAILISNQI